MDTDLRPGQRVRVRVSPGYFSDGVVHEAPERRPTTPPAYAWVQTALDTEPRLYKRVNVEPVDT